MRIRLHLICAMLLTALCLSVALPVPATAQDERPTQSRGADPAILVADKVFLEGKTRLVAEGNVEALQDGTRIKARRIAYDRETDRLTIDGPITISQGEDTLVLADAAEMAAGFRNGLLSGARMVLNQQVQLAAHQLNRINGRYSQLYKTAVTSCRVCNSSEPPLWQIRARKVTHDQIERQIYFEDAQLRVMDVPIFYLPRLRLPDPTLERASGFLVPSLRGNSRLSTGIRIPYFIRLGDHRDLTVAPFVSPNTRTLELRYRQAFRRGRIEFEGAVSNDTIYPNTRAYLFGRGQFDLKRDFKLGFNIEMVSDKSYLIDYDYSDTDRLKSDITIGRARRDEYIGGALVHYHSLRVSEDASTQPTIIGDFDYERRFFPRTLGGELRVSAGAHSHFRYSTLSVDGPDSDAIVDGRDVTRLGLEANWRRSWTLAGGIRARMQTGFAADKFITGDDSTRRRHDAQVTPMAAVTLRWPWQKVTPTGAAHVVEPVVQFGWTGGERLSNANDESTRVEFDEGNLLSLSRFPAPDRRERGAVTTYGLNWNRLGPDGWQSDLTLGQVTRADADNAFSPTSGLRGTRSDLLIAGQLRSAQGLSLTARGLFDKNLDLSKGEARAGYHTSRLGLGASYVWLGPDAFEDRPNTVSEWSLDGLYRVGRHWSGRANVRYDVVSNKTAEAGVGLIYRNECVEIDLSLSRRFTSSVILTPSTDFSFTVGIKGFSAGGNDKSYTRTCRN
ncbi:MAG: LPS-assembly protein [Rhodobacteraceae bacterium HLUCCO07]|nr:MAG: LPS-assembly protein [Rhodobacteraceae bacterium HLUCCO07]